MRASRWEGKTLIFPLTKRMFLFALTFLFCVGFLVYFFHSQAYRLVWCVMCVDMLVCCNDSLMKRVTTCVFVCVLMCEYSPRWVTISTLCGC